MGEVPMDTQKISHNQISDLIRNAIEEETGRSVIEVDLFLEDDPARGQDDIGALVRFRQE